MDRLLIVDGSNLLFQMFFGMPARIVNAQGKAIQGTLGFVGALIRIIKKTEPSHVVVLFDGQCQNERCKTDTAYKANRIDYSLVSESESPFSQIDDVYTALDYLKIKTFETVCCETDDLVAGYVKRYGNTAEIVISSFDSDFFQLITDNVSVLRYRGENSVICTPRYVEERFGVSPCRYADFKSMTGDTADNIKGADKVGPKTAAALLKQFGSLEGVIDHAQSIVKPSIKESIIKSTERLILNYKLIKLNGTEQLPFELQDLKYIYSGITTNEVLKGIGLK